MTRLIITLQTENAAFDNLNSEVSRILKDLAEKLESCNYPESLRDINGNKVGTVEYL